MRCFLIGCVLVSAALVWSSYVDAKKPAQTTPAELDVLGYLHCKGVVIKYSNGKTAVLIDEKGVFMYGPDTTSRGGVLNGDHPMILLYNDENNVIFSSDGDPLKKRKRD